MNQAFPESGKDKETDSPQDCSERNTALLTFDSCEMGVGLLTC